jgi:hypothetical protein
MRYIIILAAIFFFSFISNGAVIDGKLVEILKNESLYKVSVEMKSSCSVTKLGGVTLIIKFNELAINFAENPIEGVDYEIINFSSLIYEQTTVTRPLEDEIRINITLAVGYEGAIITTDFNAFAWLKFNVIDPSLAPHLRWNTTDNDFILFTDDNLTTWGIGNFIDIDSDPLPVELVSFTAMVNGNEVLLKWSTSNEINNYGFQVERKSVDQDWRILDFIEGFGNSNSEKLYQFDDNTIPKAGKYFYRLKQIDINGDYTYSEEISVEINLPLEFKLHQNHPNPFNPSTIISFELPYSQKIIIDIYDILGNKVIQLINEEMEKGSHTVTFNGTGLSSGIYFYKAISNNYSAIRKMILLK